MVDYAANLWCQIQIFHQRQSAHNIPEGPHARLLDPAALLRTTSRDTLRRVCFRVHRGPTAGVARRLHAQQDAVQDADCAERSGVAAAGVAGR